MCTRLCLHAGLSSWLCQGLVERLPWPGDACLPCRTKELVELTFETIREKYHGVYLPASIARGLAAPREMLKNKVHSWGSSWVLPMGLGLAGPDALV